MNIRMITRTSQPVQHPWPADTYLQGGERGIVLVEGGTSYSTAFVEAFPRSPDTFLRGEGATIADAEDDCWQKYQKLAACPAHPEHGPFEPRGYRNGSGFCTRCNTWFSRVLPEQPEDPGRRRPLLERALLGDDQALTDVLTAVVEADPLPAPGGDR